MRGVAVDQSVVERAEDGVKDKKKKRRQNRRLKQNVQAPVNGVHGEALECLHSFYSSDHLASSVSHSNSKQHEPGSCASNEHGAIETMHLYEQLNCVESGAMEHQRTPLAIGQRTYPKPCPTKNSCEKMFIENFNASNQNSCGIQEKIFSKHWSMEHVSEALEKGDAFRVLFRVNAHNRLEAYCKIDGVKTDILISGSSQNRAVEGDIVVITVDPLSLWTRLKGSNGPLNSSGSIEDYSLLPKGTEMIGDTCKNRRKIHADFDDPHDGKFPSLVEKGCHQNGILSDEIVHPELVGNINDCCASGTLHVVSSNEQNNVNGELERICAALSSFPCKRPTGKVVGIIEKSPRRDTVVGFLSAKKWIKLRKTYKEDVRNTSNSMLSFYPRYISLIPMDPKFPEMMVLVEGLPGCIKKRLEFGDATVEMELMAACIDGWAEESPAPQAHVLHSFGRGGEVEPRIAAILFENGICCSDFSQESLSCLPQVPWEVPRAVISSRRDLRNLCIFTIDPSTATDLDDALSIENLPNEVCRVGVHIADASYFIQPDSALDIESQVRSTSVFMVQRKLPMLPPLLSENFGSLTPGVDRLAMSIFFEISAAGDVIDRWIGRTVVRSCCKLSYEHAQNIIDGILDAESLNMSGDGFPKLHGHFDWLDVIQSVKNLSDISKILAKNRFDVGALRLAASKVFFLVNENGNTYGSIFSDHEDSHSLVEEFMILANRTAAEIITRAYPESALLRRHPEPDSRKLREFETFCGKYGLELDASSGQLHLSLQRIKEKLKDDSVMFDILISYATKPMQFASYICSGVSEEYGNDWSHYALAVPVYTHFTSPLRRYPDILVHRTLAAAVEAENMYLRDRVSQTKCFTGIQFDKDAADSSKGQEALSAAARKFGVPSMVALADAAAYCNKKALASRNVQSACDKLYMWVMLRKQENILSEARVLGLGPRFMSIYINKLAIERRIYYDDVDGLMVEWLDATSTLVLSFPKNQCFHRRGNPGRTLDSVAWVVAPYSLNPEIDLLEDSGIGCFATPIDAEARLGSNGAESTNKHGGSDAIDPMVFPLTVHLLSTIPVALFAIGGDDGPIDIGARLYVGSYFV